MDKLSNNNDLSMIHILCNKKYDNTTMKTILQCSIHKTKYRNPPLLPLNFCLPQSTMK